MSTRIETYPLSSFRLFSRASGPIVILFGVLALVGWVFNINFLKSVLSSQVAMNPLTALAFILVGAVLWLSQKEAATQKNRFYIVLSAVVVLMGLAKLGDYFVGLNFGLDGYLFREKLVVSGPVSVNRMAPNTALNFVLSGIALMLVDVQTRRGIYPGQIIAFIVLVNSGLALIGYAYGMTSLYGIASFIPMALNTALAFTFLSLGILFSRPNKGSVVLLSGNRPGGVMARRLLPAIIGVSIFVGWFLLEGERAGLYNSTFAVTLFVLSSILIFGILVWVNSRALDRMDLERERTEEERDHFFNLSLDMLCIAGVNGYFKQVNPSWQSILGWSPEELLSKPYLEFIHPDDREPTIAEAQKLSLGRTTITFENRYVCKDGTYRWLQWKAIPYMEKEIIYATARDVTERKESDQAIKQLVEKLQSNTVQLEAANKELEAFSYSVSHDLRAPLRAMDGFSQALLDNYSDHLDDRGKDHLRRVRAASQRMAQLIDDMLNLSRVTRTEMSRERVDLSFLAKTILDELRNNQPERQVDCRIVKGAIATGDGRLLRQVLENLLGNAWKFTAKHPRAIIEFGMTSDHGRPVYFVRDDGAGFDMTYANKLFGVFQRMHAATEFSGTGVGLATVQRIVHRHGGRVWAQAEIEKGARFYFTLI